ncbi:MAG: hypothetical protein ABSA62_12640 [Methyloceanibacter sp.]|jgi:phage terminase large subunit
MSAFGGKADIDQPLLLGFPSWPRRALCAVRRRPSPFHNGAFAGAYYAQGLAQAKAEDRIGIISADPLARTRLFVDIGGSGARADTLSIWVVQFSGDRISVLDYIEGQGQVLAYHVNELRARGYQSAEVYLPHDGINANNVTGKTYADHWRDAEFSVTVIKNQGPGAAAMRIEAVRRLFNKVWFNEATTEAGRDALGYYHERRDERRDVQLGPEHDWSSHAADAFGLMAVSYEEPGVTARFNRKINYPNSGVA